MSRLNSLNRNKIEKKSSDILLYQESEPVVFSEGFETTTMEDHPGEVTTTVEDAFESFIEGPDSFGEIAKDMQKLDDVYTEFVEDHGDEKISIIPGSEAKESDFEDNEEEDEDEGDYVNDGNLKRFLEYVKDMYPAKIPKHDGKSTLGCERAKSWLERLDREISTAIRKDHDGFLDISALEEIRTSIMADTAKLAKHINLLKNKFKDSSKKKASVDSNGIPTWTSPSGIEIEYGSLKKEAATPNKMFIAVSPFERAISGIMINAHVSAGHSIEEVYEFLAKKYDITPREELAIMQICMDSGFHIFKDRGTFSGGKDSESKDGKSGVDFIKNYFA